ncbi:MAG: dTMP kinase [Candidatus Taylorbacteria bacterium]|nr:dTMP kinase [Candidatus Taylorbacteria bacterium]
MIKNPYPGKFITFEGIDGSGKSDQFKIIRELLVAVPDINIVFTKEPPNSSIGVEIYDILRGQHPTIKLENLSELEMQRKYFLARRMQYQDLNLPVLRAGAHVISDRGVLSVAYGLKSVNDLDHFFSIEKAMFDYHKVPFISPDLNLIYDVDVEIALERLKEKNRALDKFEQRVVLERTRANYLAISEKVPNCVVIDGTPPVEEVFKETKKHVFRLLGLKI